jgi:hypothetical protein
MRLNTFLHTIQQTKIAPIVTNKNCTCKKKRNTSTTHSREVNSSKIKYSMHYELAMFAENQSSKKQSTLQTENLILRCLQRQTCKTNATALVTIMQKAHLQWLIHNETRSTYVVDSLVSGLSGVHNTSLVLLTLDQNCTHSTF